MKLTKEKSVLMDVPVMKASTRSWSPMRCMISPTILVSKKCKGRRISLARKSEIKAILILVFTCSNIQLRMKSTDSLAIKITNCDIRIKVMKPRLLSRIPVSTRLCVRKGRMSCSTLAVTMPSTSCAISLL